MSLVLQRDPTVVHLSVNDNSILWMQSELDGVLVHKLSEIALPGEVVERFDDSGEVKWRKASGDLTMPSKYVLMDDELNNTDLDTAYAVDSVPLVRQYSPGGVFFGFILDGQVVVAGDKLAQTAAGVFRIPVSSTAAAGTALFTSLTTISPSGANGRARIVVDL